MEASLMLASNMLMLLGDKPAKVQQQILDIQKNRYQMLRGFYASEVGSDAGEPGSDSDTLHAIELEEGAWAIGKTIPQIQATGLSLNIAGFCRDGFKSLAPSSETKLKAGDVLVLCGKKARLYWCEERLLRGHAI
ncbi:MAG: TrkA C-terminal domain-containing protein, partial [Pseudomonadota bacterium]